MPRSYFTPVLQGQVQTAYNHQFGTAYPGQLWSVTDNTLVDHGAVALPQGNTPAELLIQSRGLIPGRAVSMDIALDSPRTGVDPFLIIPWDPAKVPEGMFGVLVRNEQMSSNSEGNACWFDKETANILRSVHWGRIWVELFESASAIQVGDPVYIQANGTFNNTGGTQWPGAKFISEDKDGIAAIQFYGRSA